VPATQNTPQAASDEPGYGGIAGADLVAGTALGKTVDWALAHMGQKTLQRNLLNYNFANFAVRNGQYQANILGLSPQQMEKILPFPQAPSSVTVQSIEAPQNEEDVTPTAESDPAPERPWWKKAIPLVGAVLTGGALAAGGAAAYHYSTQPPSVINETTMPGEIGLQVE